MRPFIVEAESRRSLTRQFLRNGSTSTEQMDEMRYGNAHVERFFLRGVEPDYINAFPLFAVAEWTIHLGV